MKAIIVGSGAGGGTVAKELAKSGISVTVIEKGPITHIKKAYTHYNILNVGTEVSQTVCVGGTTLVTVGNAVRTCEELFKNLGIDLSSEFDEIDAELCVKTLPDSHFGDGTKKIMESAKSLGFEIEKMPKFIDPSLCKPCGKCAFGCSNDAKWTSMEFIEEAEKYGANIVENTPVTNIIVSGGEVKGVKSEDKIFEADIVVISAGAIETPRLLQKIGINAGENLFVDTFVTVGGMLKKIKFNKELPMNALIKFDDFIIGPHFSEVLVNKLQKFKARKKDVLGLMIKIKDEPSGRVTQNEVIKFNTAEDVALLAEGSAIAGSILVEAGVDPKTLVSTHARGAHPGGTAAIGDVVDKNLQTEIESLYVADASVFPEAPGAPPVLTIIALAKRLAKHIVNEKQ
ncbi:MAG: GMC family oxidoreductase [Methanobacterium sp.]|uniref:GMC family oxidoreductase N-terminal domain-containing protein n=1 Tax=Methanobacterium sp. TaxID=2164 RepID=UPI003D6568CF|nr:GMC family oxidoreductase [Methanobacterium sp.]